MSAKVTFVIKTSLLFLALVLVGLLLGGCHLRPLLSEVSVSPALISPNADGSDDATNIQYSISRNADLSIYFQDAQGQKYHFRQAQRRSAGDYRVQWGGVINQPRWLENEYGRELVKSWVLPDGDYTWVVEATDDQGNTERAEGPMQIQGGDTLVPQLQKFTVALPTFTPNQDGLTDRTGIGYYLNKNVDNVLVYLYQPDRPDLQFPLEEQEGATLPGEQGFHYYDYDGGVDLGADPPPDGTYIVQAEARDQAGHHVVVSDTLTIDRGGKPRALIVNGTIQWGDAVRSLEGTEVYLPLGSTLCFTTYVENYGRVPLRTSGPPSGTSYRSDESFNTLAAREGEDSFYEQPGVWRLGIRFDTSQLDFPYRWAVGKPDELRCETIEGQEQCFLDPGRRGTVSGCIELIGPFPRNEIYAWGGLIHQWVGISAENNYVDRILIHVGEP